MPSPWPRRLVIFGLLWGSLALIAVAISEPTPKNLTYLFAIPSAGLYTLALYLARRFWLPWLSRHPVRNATLLGIINAAVIETEFLGFQVLFGAEGVAAHPNLLMDLLITMPWYVGMVAIFVYVQNRQRFGPAYILLLGAVYETGADGVVSQVAGLVFGGSRLLDPGYWVLLAALAFWQFIPVYSSMVLPPAWVIDQLPSPPKPPISAWRDALRPLLWLIPFAVYVIALLFLLAMAGG